MDSHKTCTSPQLADGSVQNGTLGNLSMHKTFSQNEIAVVLALLFGIGDIEYLLSQNALAFLNKCSQENSNSQ